MNDSLLSVIIKYSIMSNIVDCVELELCSMPIFKIDFDKTAIRGLTFME